ncbi:hypothetical protein [Streptomyces sp. NPDC020667]|uniref:hypothetical protein n=1 Tax=Streptomyces sp. NPDC020667 TaxID=3154895 RepID=UPI0033FFF0D8
MYEIISAGYGRQELRLLGVGPGGPADVARDLRLTMTLDGDFTAAFVEGDNADVLPTRSMTNAAACFVHDHVDAAVEILAPALGTHLLRACPAASTASVTVAETPWTRLPGSHHTFASGPGDQWLADATVRREPAATRVVSGITGLHRAVTTGSAFTGFLVDDYTVPQAVHAADRVLHLSGELRWEYDSPPPDHDRYRAEVLGAFTGSTLDQRSRSSQHAAYLSARAVLDACSLVASVTLRFTHHAHAPLDLAPFGRVGRGRVCLSTDSSSGTGSITLRRVPG